MFAARKRSFWSCFRIPRTICLRDRLMQMDCVAFDLCVCLLAPVMAAHAQAPAGEAIYKQRCAACHDQSGSRIPPREALQKMPALRILRAMNSGAMMTVAYPL